MAQSLGGDPILAVLSNWLVFLNAAIIFIVPFVAWLFVLSIFGPLKKIHERQKQFVSDVSHELQTPLSIINAGIEVALKKNRTIKEYREILMSSRQEVERLDHLVENLLFLVREDKGNHKILFLKVDVTDLLIHAVADFSAVAADKNVTLSFHPAGENVVVRGDKSMLRQLFSNLLDNAIKYTNEKGGVDVVLSSTKKEAVIRIKDTGIGIAREKQEKIFDRFYRVDTSRSEAKGYGLGLSICQSIVSLHKGNISVHSEIGKGSTFTVFLPKDF